MIAAVAVVYFAAAKLGLSLAFATKQVTAFWPPAGIAVVALLVLGYRVWPGITLGALLVNATANEPLTTAAGIAVGNTLGPVCAVLVLTRWMHIDREFARLRDVFGLVVAAILGMTVSASLGVANLVLGGLVTWSAYASVWWVWWIGDAMGVLIVAPLLLTWVAAPRVRWGGLRAIECVGLFLGLLLVSRTVFSGAYQLQYTVFPFIVWAALRFGQRETATAAVLMSAIAIGETIHDRGPFASGTLDARLVLLETFLAVGNLTALILGAVSAEHRLAKTGLEEARADLESRVRERTAELIHAESTSRGDRALLAEAQTIAQLGSWDWDLQTDRVTWSDELCRIVGLEKTAEGPSDECVLASIHADDRARLREVIECALRDKEPFSVEHRVVRPDSVVRTLHTQGRVFVDDEGRVFRMAGTGHDVTVLREMQEKLVFADRMATVGTMAAGVAHEVNNPLTYVVANLEVIADEIRNLSEGEPSARLKELAEITEEAREGADRIRKIIRGMQAFSRADEEHRTLVDVRAVLASSRNIARNEIRHRARLTEELGDVPMVEADAARLGQVFINLLVNAAHAIPAGDVDNNEIRIVTKTDQAGRALVEIRDSGRGIPATTRSRIFDPFFTTKPIGEGTGLGLAICHGIVTALDGEITVESRVGTGSVFRVVLPAASGERKAPIEVPSLGRAPRTLGRGRILVVDDDDVVGGVLRRTLSDHEVTVVASGMDAIALLSSGASFEVILCDLMMPTMSGMELYAELGLRWPSMLERVVFVTGGAFTASARAFLDRVPNERLEKPFDVRSVRDLVGRCVNEILGDGRDSSHPR